MRHPQDLLGTDENELREGVRRAYSAAASAPEDTAPFPAGRDFALSLGYRSEDLNAAPEAASIFTGVSCMPALMREIPPEQPVKRCLDVGCGAGLDAILTARAFPEAMVTGIDFSAEMLARASSARQQAGAGAVFLCQAGAERLPFRDGSFDVVTANGIFNLNPARAAIFGELARVLRPGGRLYAAELIVGEGTANPVPRTAANWFS